MPREVVGVRVRLEHAGRAARAASTPPPGTARSRTPGRRRPPRPRPRRRSGTTRSRGRRRRIGERSRTWRLAPPRRHDHSTGAARRPPDRARRCAALAAPAAASAHANPVAHDSGRSRRARARARAGRRALRRRRARRAGQRRGCATATARCSRASRRRTGRRSMLPLRAGPRRAATTACAGARSRDDGHVVQGVLAFCVGTRPSRRRRRRCAPTDEVGFGTVFSRCVFFAGLLVAAGLALFDLLVWRPLAQSHLRTGWIALGLAAMFVSSHGLVHASHGGLATRFGLTIEIASAIAATGAAAAAIAVADRSAAPFGIWLAVLLLPVPTVAGHALDPGRSWLEVPVDVLHVTAAALWIGGLFALVVVVPREGEPSETLAAVVRRFSTLALASVVVVGLTGGVRALSELSAFSQLWTTDYGRVLLAKTAIFAVLVGLGALSRAGVREGLGRLRERRARRACSGRSARRGRGYPDFASSRPQLSGRRVCPRSDRVASTQSVPLAPAGARARAAGSECRRGPAAAAEPAACDPAGAVDLGRHRPTVRGGQPQVRDGVAERATGIATSSASASSPTAAARVTVRMQGSTRNFQRVPQPGVVGAPRR